VKKVLKCREVLLSLVSWRAKFTVL